MRNRFVSVVIPFSRISMQQLSGDEDSFERRFPVVQNHIIDVVENLLSLILRSSVVGYPPPTIIGSRDSGCG